MKQLEAKSLFENLSEIEDPRIERRKLHSLIDILVIAVCAFICAAETWEDVEEFGKAKHEWFGGFLELENGIPSHDTFRRVFILVDSNELRNSFLECIRAAVRLSGGELVNIDGKKLRGSKQSSDGKGALNMVSAWAAGQSLVLGQVKTDEKSNEITAIPELLKILDLTGCIVTIDAMGCQTEIVADIIDQEADYVIARGRQSRQFARRCGKFYGLGRAERIRGDRV